LKPKGHYFIQQLWSVTVGWLHLKGLAELRRATNSLLVRCDACLRTEDFSIIFECAKASY